jgi:eukaryotic-like serine/threonine-protein kinase
MEKAAEAAYLIRFESFEVNLRSGELLRAGERVRLPEQSFRILAMLLERPGDVVTRQEIQENLWPNDTIVEFENSINAAVKRLRVALGDSADQPRYVQTLARRGYRWMVPVERTAATPRGGKDSPAPVESPQAVESAVGLLGKRVSHYRVLDMLGGGGMGVVYAAEDLKLGRRVALKFLPEELADDMAAMQRFEREARSASSLNHPNICTIYEVQEHEGRPFIAMELLEGKTLSDFIAHAHTPGTDAKEAFRPEQLFDIAVQIAQGLTAAHQRGIIHRDIKPANIYVSHSGQVKILDFGLAKLLTSEGLELTTSTLPRTRAQGSDLSLSFPGQALGTAAYMSPEQVRGENVDFRTDLFSFGSVLYEVATGVQAFTGSSVPEVHRAIVDSVPVPVRRLNPAVPPQLEKIISAAMEKDRTLRCQSAAAMLAELKTLQQSSPSAVPVAMPSGTTRLLGKSRWRVILLAGLAIVAAVSLAITYYYRQRKPAQITEQDTIVLADFANGTGDAIFDDTLKDALRLSLRQSPFLNLLSERKVSQALTLMTRPADTPLTPEIARDVCRRVGSKSYLAGAIATLNGEYVIGLKAVNCASGETLAQEQVTAENKKKVLEALSEAASKIRERLGESLATVAKFDVPLNQTTSSLEALKAYNLGMKVTDRDQAVGVNHFLRAIQIDPDFAMAYLAAAETYTNLNQSSRATEYFTKAFQLRDHATPREKLEIESLYYAIVTGELEKAAQTYQKTIESYPKSAPPYGNLSVFYSLQGRYEKAEQLARQVLQIAPAFGGEAYQGIAEDLIALQRFDEAHQILKAALDRRLDIDGIHKNLYVLGFLEWNTSALAEQTAWLEGKPEYENLSFSLRSDTEAYAGRLSKARELTRRAADSAARADNKEAGATWLTGAALREALFGNELQARQYAAKALKMAPTSQQVEVEGALALAMANDSAHAQVLTQNLKRRYPLHTLVQSRWLPTIESELALGKGKPAEAIELLKTAAPTELGSGGYASSNSCMYPVYIRGQAYLAQSDGRAAAGEFQKILEHNGVVWNCPTGALARLGLARANALQSRTAQGVSADAARSRALTAYQDFFGLWKGADRDIPVLKQAKAEYAKLQ